jgi:hypothetical protein
VREEAHRRGRDVLDSRFHQAAFGQSGRVGWDGTWFGGWEKGTAVQLIFAGETLIGFYFRDNYEEILRSLSRLTG